MLGKCAAMEAGRKKARGTAPSQAQKGLLHGEGSNAGSESQAGRTQSRSGAGSGSEKAAVADDEYEDQSTKATQTVGSRSSSGAESGSTGSSGRSSSGGAAAAQPKQPQWGDDEATAEDLQGALSVNPVTGHSSAASIGAGNGGIGSDPEDRASLTGRQQQGRDPLQPLEPHSRPHKFNEEERAARRLLRWVGLR